MMDQANSHLAQSCKCRTPTGPHANRAPRLRQRCRAWLSDAPTGQRICASPCRGCGDCASAGLRCGRRRYDGDITAQRTRLTPTGQRPVGFSSSVPPTRRTPTGPGMRRPRICGTEMRQTEIRRRDLRDGDTADGDTTEISPGRRYLRAGDLRRCAAPRLRRGDARSPPSPRLNRRRFLDPRRGARNIFLVPPPRARGDDSAPSPRPPLKGGSPLGRGGRAERRLSQIETRRARAVCWAVRASIRLSLSTRRPWSAGTLEMQTRRSRTARSGPYQ